MRLGLWFATTARGRLVDNRSLTAAGPAFTSRLAASLSHHQRSFQWIFEFTYVRYRPPKSSIESWARLWVQNRRLCNYLILPVNSGLSEDTPPPVTIERLTILPRNHREAGLPPDLACEKSVLALRHGIKRASALLMSQKREPTRRRKAASDLLPLNAPVFG
jgi:hypothetical protein